VRVNIREGIGADPPPFKSKAHRGCGWHHYWWRPTNKQPPSFSRSPQFAIPRLKAWGNFHHIVVSDTLPSFGSPGRWIPIRSPRRQGKAEYRAISQRDPALHINSQSLERTPTSSLKPRNIGRQLGHSRNFDSCHLFDHPPPASNCQLHAGLNSTSYMILRQRRLSDP